MHKSPLWSCRALQWFHETLKTIGSCCWNQFLWKCSLHLQVNTQMHTYTHNIHTHTITPKHHTDTLTHTFNHTHTTQTHTHTHTYPQTPHTHRHTNTHTLTHITSTARWLQHST